MHALKSTPLVFWGLMLCEFCQAQSPQLGIDRNAGVVRVTVQGETNRDYSLQAGSLASTNWSFLSTLSLSTSNQSWFDSASASLPMRFYRAQKLDTNRFGRIFEYADDFRLIDHQGISRSLYYLENDPSVKAVVLIFTGNGCSNVAQMV